MKHSKHAEESTTTVEAKYCPYCGGSRLATSKDNIQCLECRASFVAVKREKDKEPCVRAPSNPARAAIASNHLLPSLSEITRANPQPGSISMVEFYKTLHILDVPDSFREAAQKIYAKARAISFGSRRMSGQALAAAAVYVVCKQNGLPKSLDEIAVAFGVSKAEAEDSYTGLLNEIGYSSPMLSGRKSPASNESVPSLNSIFAVEEREPGFGVEKFLEKKGTYEFLRLLKESPRRWKTLEKELPLSPRTLSERISQAQALGLIEKVRRLKIGAPYYRLTKRGNEVFEVMTGDARVY